MTSLAHVDEIIKGLRAVYGCKPDTFVAPYDQRPEQWPPAGGPLKRLLSIEWYRRQVEADPRWPAECERETVSTRY